MTRSHPERAALDFHSKLANKFEGTDLIAFNKRIDTFEGPKALDDMYYYLKSLEPTRQMIESPALTRAAEFIAKEKGLRGEFSHEKPRVINQKVEELGKMEGKVGELMCFGTNSPLEAVSYFLMDDGLASRKRRRMLMDPQYHYVGVGSAPHQTYGSVTVILLA